MNIRQVFNDNIKIITMNEQIIETNVTTRLDGNSSISDDKLIFQFSSLVELNNKNSGILMSTTEKKNTRDDAWKKNNNNDDIVKTKKEGLITATDCTEDSSSCSSDDTFVNDSNYDSNHFLLHGDDDEDTIDVDSHDCIDSYELCLEDDDDNDVDSNTEIRKEASEAACAVIDDEDDTSSSLLDFFDGKSRQSALMSNTISNDTISSSGCIGDDSRNMSPDIKEEDSTSLSQSDHIQSLAFDLTAPDVDNIRNDNSDNNATDEDNEDSAPIMLSKIVSRMERTNRFLQHQDQLSSRGGDREQQRKQQQDGEMSIPIRRRSVQRTPSPKPLRPTLKYMSKSQQEQSSFIRCPKVTPKQLRKVRSSSPQPKKVVRFFDDATVREYAITVGAYSYVTDTCPLQLSWEHSASKRIPLKDVLSPGVSGSTGTQVSTLRRLTIEERRKRVASIQGIAADDVCNVEYKNLLDMIKSTKSNLDRALIGISHRHNNNDSSSSRKSISTTKNNNCADDNYNKFHDSWPSGR